jgi:hypothetical protein
MDTMIQARQTKPHLKWVKDLADLFCLTSHYLILALENFSMFIESDGREMRGSCCLMVYFVAPQNPLHSDKAVLDSDFHCAYPTI